MSKILEVQNLQKSYDQGRNLFRKKEPLKVLESVSFTIEEGKTFGLVGDSGSGKTTVARIIAGLLPASGGEITFEGLDFFKAKGDDKERIEREIQMVFQNPSRALNPVRTIGWILHEALRIHGIKKEERDRRIQRLLQEVGLDEALLKRYPHQLSGGQKQRVVIVSALLIKPKLVVLDEAVTSLDVSIRAQILNLLVDLQKKFNLSYLFISHDLRVIKYMSDEVGVLQKGKLVERGPTEILFNRPLHPYTKNLFCNAQLLQVSDCVSNQEYKGLCGGKDGMIEVEPSHWVSCETPKEKKDEFSS